mmetsp:Transcript_29464/g.77694  ORF Transcript_29464/g.77694 Transcript_29464/m.77694 type:complete len:222 (+) Transcript_29464:270-935(+)
MQSSQSRQRLQRGLLRLPPRRRRGWHRGGRCAPRPRPLWRWQWLRWGRRAACMGRLSGSCSSRSSRSPARLRWRPPSRSRAAQSGQLGRRCRRRRTRRGRPPRRRSPGAVAAGGRRLWRRATSWPPAAAAARCGSESRAPPAPRRPRRRTRYPCCGCGQSVGRLRAPPLRRPRHRQNAPWRSRRRGAASGHRSSSRGLSVSSSSPAAPRPPARAPPPPRRR